jgi:hypothetical protein
MDTAAIAQMDFVDKSKIKDIPAQLVWTIGRNALEKKDLIMLDMIANNHWKRPIYFSTTLATSNYLNLKEYMQMEGLAMRLMPYRFVGAADGAVNTDIMYENMMKKMYWRGLNDETRYFDENYRRFPLNSRKSFFSLAAELYNEGKTDKAKEVAHFCLNAIPDKAIPYDPYSAQFVGLLIRLGEEKKAFEIADVMTQRADEELTYFKRHKIRNEMETQSNLYILNQIVMSMKNEGKEKESAKYEAVFKKHIENYQ